MHTWFQQEMHDLNCVICLSHVVDMANHVWFDLSLLVGKCNINMNAFNGNKSINNDVKNHRIEKAPQQPKTFFQTDHTLGHIKTASDNKTVDACCFSELFVSEVSFISPCPNLLETTCDSVFCP